MRRSALSALVAITLTYASAARADIPYWKPLHGFSPFARAIAVDPSDPEVVWVGASNAATHFGELGTLEGTGVHRSGDGGQTFVSRSAGLANPHVVALAIDPSNPNVVYAGLRGAGVFKTTDAGLSWAPANGGLTKLDVLTLAIDPTSPSTVYAGSLTGGVHCSVDGGATWTPSSGVVNLTVHALAIDPATPTTIYAATGSGVLKSTDGGATFAPTGALAIASPGGGTPPVIHDVRAIAIDASAPSTILAGTWEGGGVFRSTDGGASWTHTSVGLKTHQFGNWRFITALAQDPVASAVFYVSSTDDTYRSLDGGLSWAPFSTGLARGECYAFGTHPSGRVYTGSVFVELHRLNVRASGVNHFRCFKARAKGFVPQPLAFTDRFGSGTVTALKPVRYCTPTDPMGEGAVDPTSHLVCYKTSKVPFTAQNVSFLSQRIDGYRAYRVERPETVCLPATAGVPAAAPRDAYRCIAGPHWKSWPIDLTLTDAFGSQLVSKHRTDRLCVPTDLDGAGENLVEGDVDLRCDVPKGATGRVTPATVTTTDRFGTLEVTLVKPDSHCFQALESRD